MLLWRSCGLPNRGNEPTAGQRSLPVPSPLRGSAAAHRDRCAGSARRWLGRSAPLVTTRVMNEGLAAPALAQRRGGWQPQSGVACRTVNPRVNPPSRTLFGAIPAVVRGAAEPPLRSA